MLKIGSHVSMNGPDYFLGSVKEALSYKSTTFMFYTGAPQNSFRTPLEKLKISEAHSLLKENNINPMDLVVHAPYLINLGNLDPEKVQVSYNMLVNEIDRTVKMGCRYLVLHPGAALKFPREESLNQITKYINLAIQTNPNICVLIETMAGKGSEVGISFEEVASIVQNIEKKSSIGVCLDTCHINDAGYDLSNPSLILDEFDRIIGLSYLKVIHVNDSKNERGMAKDRHANIGYGTIGFSNLIRFIYDERLQDKLFILETPYVKYEETKDEFPPYLFEIESIRNQTFNENLFQDIYQYYKKN